MTSNIDPNTINPNFPVSDTDNSTQGFRDNFAAIEENFATANVEITNLQSVQIGMTGPVGATPVQIGEGSNIVLLQTSFPVSNASYSLTFPGSGAIKIPIGGIAQRPPGALGLLRYNSDISSIEFYSGASWSTVGAGPTGPTGAQGAASSIAGPTGATGPQGLSGPAGAASLVTGPTGIAGTAGVTGPTGPISNTTGPTGPAGTTFNGGVVSNSISITSNIASISTVTGALTVAGGVGIAGNVYIGGNASVSSNLSSLNFSTLGNVGIGTLSPQASLQVVTNSNSQQGILLDSYTVDGSYYPSEVIMRTSRGTQQFPVAIQSGDTIGLISTEPFNGNLFVSNAAAHIKFVAEENFSSTNMGTKIVLGAVTTGSNVLIDRLVIDGNGVTISSNLTISGSLIAANTVLSNVHVANASSTNSIVISNNLTVYGQSYVGNIDIGNDLVISSNVASNITSLSGNLSINSANSYINGNLIVSGNAIIDTNLIIGGTFTTPNGGIVNAVNGITNYTVADNNAIMISCNNEFGLDTVLQIGLDGTSFNGIYDEYVTNVSIVSEARPDFTITVQKELSRMPNIETVLFNIRWFTVSSGAGVNMNAVVPGINQTVLSNLANSNQWSAGGVSSLDALLLPTSVYGTINDLSLLNAARYLSDRGYKIGFVPIVVGVDTDSGLTTTQQTQWRGSFTWPTDLSFSNWLADYVGMVTYYVNLFVSAGINLDLVYIASELESVTLNADNTRWAAFIPAMQGLADYIKSINTSTRITYAANFSEYGVTGNFRLDSLWSYYHIDEVGIDWFFPLTLSNQNNISSLQAGLRSGENMDYNISLSNSAQYDITTSNGMGKVGVTQTPIVASAGSKNVLGFWYGNHYLAPQPGILAEATPLPGFDRTYNPNGLGLMTGTGNLSIGSNVITSGTSGQHAPLPINSSWINFNGGQSASFTLPFTNGIPPTGMDITLSWQIFGSINGGNLLNIPNIANIYTSNSEVIFSLGNTTTQTFNLTTLDANVHVAHINVSVTNLTVTTTVDGNVTITSVNPNAMTTFTSGATAYVGGADLSTYQTNMNLYNLSITETINGVVTGGVFHFEEAYAGVRTAWVPKSKPIAATEIGFASINGAATDPQTTIAADIGSGGNISLPANLDPYTLSRLTQYFAEGWSPTQIYGPYGSTFAIDQMQQALSLQATLQWMKKTGIFNDISLYYLDCRPSGALNATKTGNIYFQDGPLAQFNHSVNNKLAGGATSITSNSAI
jgi:hypothetical protein